MNSSLYNDLYKKIPLKLNGYEFIKKITVGIPYIKLNLDILIRKEVALPFFQEILLKIIGCNWTNVDDISKVLGLEPDIVADIISQMSLSNLIYPTNNNLLLTPIGKKTLNNITTLIKEKDFFKNIYVNLIDGSIEFDEKYIKYSKYCSSNIYLNEKCIVDKSFLYKNMTTLKKLYIHRQIMDNPRYNKETYDELYEIIDIASSKLVYYEVEVLIYQNEIEKNIEFIFLSKNKKKNDQYSEELINNIRDNKISINNMFIYNFKVAENNFFNSQANISPKHLDVLAKNKEVFEKQLKVFIQNKGIIGLDLDYYYYTGRLLLDKEYQDILLKTDKMQIEKLFILSNHMRELFNDDSLTLIISTLLPKTKICFGYYDKEYKIKKKIINKLKKNTIVKKYRKNLVFKPIDNIYETNIIAYPNWFIKIMYEPIKVIDNKYISKEIAFIKYDKNIVEKKSKKLEQLFK